MLKYSIPFPISCWIPCPLQLLFMTFSDTSFIEKMGIQQPLTQPLFLRLGAGYMVKLNLTEEIQPKEVKNHAST